LLQIRLLKPTNLSRFFFWVQSLVMDDFYAGEGTDHSGVPTKLVTTNCSLHVSVYNPATMFGIHVTSGPIRLIYSEISIAVGQVLSSIHASLPHFAACVSFTPSSCE
jgi:hypothetical protein